MAEQNVFDHLGGPSAPSSAQSVPSRSPLGGVVVPAKPEKPDTPSPLRATEVWRMLSNDEKKQRNLPAEQNFQINEAGKIETVSEGGLTEAQAKAQGFYQRMRASETQMKRLKMGPQDWTTLIQQRISPTYSRANLSDDQRTQLDLMENWIAASLRLESGAAIGVDEFQKQARIFFPQPGAGEKEQAAKNQQRELAILGFGSTSGRQGKMLADDNLRALGFIDKDGNPIIDITTATTGGAGTEGPAVTVSPEDSIATFGQLTYDKDRNLVGRAYQASGGALFDAQGNALGITGVVSDESLQAPAPSFYEGVLNSITGSDQSTATTESLPDWVDMPGMNNLLSSAAWKAGFGTAFGGSPQEIAQIVQSNFPGTQVFQDEKGNYILRSATDGKDYAIKPGFQLSDVPRAANIIGAGLLTGGRSAMGVAGREALMQTGIEATQTATGGTFNPADIAAAAVLGGGIQKGFEVLPGAAGRVVGRIMGNTPPGGGGGGGGGGGAIPDIPGGIPLPGGGVSPAPAGSMAPEPPMPSVGATPSAAIPQTPTGTGGLSSAPTTGSNPLIFSVAPTEILERSGTRAKPGPGVLDDANIQDRDVVLDALGLPRGNRRLGAQTGNKSQIEDEVMISKLGEGSERMQDQFDRESQHLGEYALDLIDRTGGTLNLNTTARGAAIVKPLESYQAWYRDQIKMLYTQADAAAAASGVPITLQGLNDALRVDSTFASKGSLITLRNGVRKYLKEINAVDKAGNPLPLETQMAENVRKYLNDNWTPENSAVIGRLKSTIDNDVLSALPVDVYANARQMRANYGDIFEKPEGLAKILEIDGPEGINRTIPLDVIGDRFTNWAQKNSAQFNNIIKTLENMPTPVLQQEGKQAVGEIRANLLESILKKNVDFEDISQGGDAMWAGSDRSLGLNMVPYKGKMVDLFGTDIANRLETLRVGARILRPVDPNPSGTATVSQRLVGKTRERLIKGTSVAAGGSIGGTLGSILGPTGTTIGAAVGGATGERIGVKMVQSAEVAARKRAIEASLDPAAKARQLNKMRARKGGQ